MTVTEAMEWATKALENLSTTVDDKATRKKLATATKIVKTRASKMRRKLDQARLDAQKFKEGKLPNWLR